MECSKTPELARRIIKSAFIDVLGAISTKPDVILDITPGTEENLNEVLTLLMETNQEPFIDLILSLKNSFS